ncbi:VWA domain-containing protein [Sorangium sp. So ce1099]|uniref:VWA domain-containing protein n=1 Tax=Sorangium sp. So ce1099 TaxID=3133331 RepID=UPI003F618899
MKNVSKRVVSSAAIGMACAVGLFSSAASADEHVLILLDRTGSMGATSVPGKTRLQVAKDRIKAFLKSAPSQPRRYAFWTFDDATYTPIFNFADNRSAAQVEIEVDAVTLGGVTPLAHSACAAIDELINYLPSEFHTKRLYLATDGEENNTLSTDQCGGPPSATNYPNLQVDSWQWKVRNKACTGDPNSPAMCGTPGMPTLLVDIDHLFDNITLRARRSLEPVPNAGLFSAFSSSDASFFSGLTSETGGRYVSVTPSTPPAQAAPKPGDASLDGCVNVTDRSLVLSQFGQNVAAGTPTDFNRDGVVNIYDYNTVLQNYGSGCPVP